MKITRMKIDNFKSIEKLDITEIDSAFILVGRNNTGKSSVIDAIRAVFGEYTIKKEDFNNEFKAIMIEITIEMDNGDPRKITHIVTPSGKRMYDDGKYAGPEVPSYLPELYYIDHRRNLKEFQNGLVNIHTDENFSNMRDGNCIRDYDEKCKKCFECIDDIKLKQPLELETYEIARLLEYKLYKLNLDEFAKSVNKHLHANGLIFHTVRYEVGIDPEEFLKVNTVIYNHGKDTQGSINSLGAGSKSIYMLSLIEAYLDVNNKDKSIIIIEDPEIFLHPQMQKNASETLYRLSKKNQIIFSTYSPNMIFNFSSKQIKQVVLDDNYNTQVLENVDIDIILDDLGYSANDLMNISFVFIVEGKQDGNRLPKLLEKYYSEIRDESGNLKRVSIVQTNSCTNIKTYANLKYINKLYLKDQFLMIRDSDGKNPNYLVKQLCSYYKQRAEEDPVNLPNVEPRNVLILKYYSFENYFLDPVIMAKIGVIKDEEEFYKILFQKYKAYLYKLPSFKRMIRRSNVRINSKEDIKNHMEEIKIHVRGHNLFDIFYGKYKKNEDEIINRYIEEAPRSNFADILNAIDSFVYFENRKKED